MNGTDHDTLLTFGADLAAAVERAMPDWVRRSVHRRLGPAEPPSTDLERRITEAGLRAAADVAARLNDLLGRDVDEQWTNPLSIVRDATRYPTEILSTLGVAPVPRDRDAVRILPDDVYDLAPANFAELGPEVHECGIRWGAAKAHVHLQRHKRS